MKSGDNRPERLVPALRFPEFRDAPPWQVKRLGEVVQWVRTNNFPRARLTDSGGEVQNIHYGDIHTKFPTHFRQLKEQIPFIKGANVSDFQESDFCRPGDIVIADASEDYSGIGKAIEIVETSHIPLVAGLHTFIARPVGGNFFCGFAGYCLGSEGVRLQIRRVAQGISVLGISKYELEKLTLPLPSLPEQRQIAGCLSSLDDLIEAREGQVAALKLHKRGLMQRLFPAPGETTPALRFPGFRDAPPWEVKRLGEVADIKRGASPRPISSPIWFDDESDIGWVRISDVTASGRVLLKTTQKLSQEGVKKSRIVPPGHIIMSICGTIGKPICTGFSVCIHDGFVVFENLRQIHEQFLFYFLERIETCWRRHGQPGTQINLNSDIVAQEKIPLPSLAEQREIVGCLSSLDDLIEAREGQVAALKLYKRGLMQKLFPAPGDTAPVLRRAERITEAAT